MSRVPTKNQMARLALLPVGPCVLHPRRNDWRPLLNHGWVEAVWPKEWEMVGSAYDGLHQYLPSLRISSDGLRALADAVEKHGQPEIPARPRTQVEAQAHYAGARDRQRATSGAAR